MHWLQNLYCSQCEFKRCRLQIIQAIHANLSIIIVHTFKCQSSALKVKWTFTNLLFEHAIAYEQLKQLLVKHTCSFGWCVVGGCLFSFCQHPPPFFFYKNPCMYVKNASIYMFSWLYRYQERKYNISVLFVFILPVYC